MIRIMLGNEPYMIDCMARKESKCLQFPDFNLLKSSTFGEEEDLFLSSYPVMDDKRVLVLTLKKLDDLKGEMLNKWTDMEVPNVIVVKATEWDGRTSFYKDCVKKGWVVSCSKKDLYNSICPLIQKRAYSKGVNIDSTVVESMLKRTGYLENEEVNMYTLMGYVNTLISLDKNISVELMESVVPSYYKEDAFCLAKLICSKDVIGLKRQAELLKGSEIETLSALLREFRISYKAKYFPLKETGATYSAFLKKEKEYLSYGIHVISDTVSGIKNGTVITKDCLMDVFLRLLCWKGGNA